MLTLSPPATAQKLLRIIIAIVSYPPSCDAAALAKGTLLHALPVLAVEEKEQLAPWLERILPECIHMTAYQLQLPVCWHRLAYWK